MESKYCGNCGAELIEGAVYCSSCGTSKEKKVNYQRHNMGIFDYYKDALSKYSTFTGRASVKDYLYFILGNMIIGFVGGIVLVILSIILGVVTQNLYLGAIIYMLVTIGYGLYILIPNFALMVRRLHDQGKSGAWVLISLVPIVGPIIILVLLFLQGNPYANQYGEPNE
jgi:uncharacterized membrane protein YhaH (DUF805 family)